MNNENDVCVCVCWTQLRMSIHMYKKQKTSGTEKLRAIVTYNKGINFWALVMLTFEWKIKLLSSCCSLDLR